MFPHNPGGKAAWLLIKAFQGLAGASLGLALACLGLAKASLGLAKAFQGLAQASRGVGDWHVQKFDKIAWQCWPAGFRRCEGSRTWHKLRRTSSFDPQTTLTVQRGSKCVKIDQIWNRTFQLKKSKNHRCSYAQALFLDSLVRTKVPACKRVGGGVGCPLGWRYRGQFCPNFGFYRSDRKNDKNLQKNSKR